MKQFTLREIGESEQFDPTSISPHASFTQASFYGDWQKSLGRVVRRFLVFRGETAVAYLQLIVYPLFGDRNYLYIPYGPVVRDHSKDFLIFLKNELLKIAKENRAVFVRFDFTPQISNDALSEFFAHASLSTYHSSHFQPRREWFLSLLSREDELLDAMHKNTRYAIRLAERKGITTEIITADFETYFESFYDLMVVTAKRNGFNLHERKYYEVIFQNLSQIKNSYLSIARYNQKILVVDLVVVFGNVANHVFGGSSDEYRSLCPSYLSKWVSIVYAKKIGCTDFNFGGISSTYELYKGWEGLSTFKRRFGGREVKHSDFFDIVVQPFWYMLYNLRKHLKKFLL